MLRNFEDVQNFDPEYFWKFVGTVFFRIEYSKVRLQYSIFEH